MSVWLLLTSTVVALGGCGPTQSTALTMETENLLDAAQAAGAEKDAPYEYHAARAYLHKAREEAGHADFEYSIEFAIKARDFAKAAKEKALLDGGTLAPSEAAPIEVTPEAP